MRYRPAHLPTKERQLLFRVYEPHECAHDGYPHVWRRGIIHQPDAADVSLRTPHLWVEEFEAGRLALKDTVGIKDVVRSLAGDRCERCKHPYRVGQSGEFDKVGPGRSVDEGQYGLFADLDQAELASILKAPRSIHWSPCDERCTHVGPTRWRTNADEAWVVGKIERAGDIARCSYEVQAAWRILTVHHLNGRKHDLRWWNLAALCQRCHLEIQNKVVMERVFPLEHTEWFKPHAAGWYSYAYTGRDLSRTETMERLDELLALERLA